MNTPTGRPAGESTGAGRAQDPADGIPRTFRGKPASSAAPVAKVTGTPPAVLPPQDPGQPEGHASQPLTEPCGTVAGDAGPVTGSGTDGVLEPGRVPQSSPAGAGRRPVPAGVTPAYITARKHQEALTATAHCIGRCDWTAGPGAAGDVDRAAARHTEKPPKHPSVVIAEPGGAS